MYAKNHLLIFSSFPDIWENVEWPRFFWTTLYMHGETQTPPVRFVVNMFTNKFATNPQQIEPFEFEP